MGKEKLKFSKMDIVTMITVAVALALAVLVVVKLFGSSNSPVSPKTEVRTTIHYYSEVDEQGSIVFYTMIEEYTDSGMHASVSYKPKTTESTSGDESSTDENATGEETTKTVFVTDANGEFVTDAEGNRVTEIVTQKPKPTYEPVTDANGEPLTDVNGDPVTQEKTETTAPETTTEDIWSVETTTNRFGYEPEYTSETGTASTIVSEINRKRTENGLNTLSSDGGLSTAARAYSLSLAMPNFFKRGSNPGQVYTFENSSGGASIYNSVISGSDAVDGDYSHIGVGVIRCEGRYYTTVVLT